MVMEWYTCQLVPKIPLTRPPRPKPRFVWPAAQPGKVNRYALDFHVNMGHTGCGGAMWSPVSLYSKHIVERVRRQWTLFAQLGGLGLGMGVSGFMRRQVFDARSEDIAYSWAAICSRSVFVCLLFCVWVFEYMYVHAVYCGSICPTFG